VAERVRRGRGTVSRLVVDLERRGWVERGDDPKDGRVVLLRLSAEGHRAVEQMSAAQAEKFARIFAAVPPSQQRRVLGALELLVRATEQSDGGMQGNGRTQSPGRTQGNGRRGS